MYVAEAMGPELGERVLGESLPTITTNTHSADSRLLEIKGRSEESGKLKKKNTKKNQVILQ